jgi:hypothetical protein
MGLPGFLLSRLFSLLLAAHYQPAASRFWAEILGLRRLG